MLSFLGLAIAIIGMVGSRHPFRIGKQVVSETLHSKPFWMGVSFYPALPYTFRVLDRIPYVLSTFSFLTGMMFIFRAGAGGRFCSSRVHHGDRLVCLRRAGHGAAA